MAIQISIREALPHEAPELSAVAFLAKSSWGYTPEQLERWRTEFLTITPAYIAANLVWVAVADPAQPAGFAAVEPHGAEAVLEHLWILPDYMGHGIGKRLFLHAAAHVSRFVFTSDPHADPFYYRMGARKIGEYYSMLQERTLTRFEYRPS